MVTTVAVLRNYCENINKRTYTGLQGIVLTFYCRKLQVLGTTDLR
jgi:hypothetical protein